MLRSACSYSLRRIITTQPIPIPARYLSTKMDITPGAPSAKIQLTSHNQYHSPRLLPSTLLPSPLPLFNQWFSEALTPPNPSIPAVHEPEAMCISSASSTGIPSSRMVLLKQVDDRGFVFYTNYNSRKSSELIANPYAALCFYWKEVSRQVRVVGRIEKVSEEEAEAYFQGRPRGSRIGAWASEQSTEVGEETLQERVEMIEGKFPVDVPKPEHWGGWRVVPFEVEFWAGQPSRLHDRFRYTRPEGSAEGVAWEVKRLAP